MNLVKKLSIALVAICPLLQGCAEELQWVTDLPKAQAQAKTENKLVFIDFNGSDWCAPCKELRSVLSSSKEFANFARTNLVLVDIDFPQRKEQSEDLKKANEALSKKYNIEGFPTVIVLNGEGKELNRTVGFGGQSAKEIIGDLEKLKKKS
jgi:protein disulfide-isomerase